MDSRQSSDPVLRATLQTLTKLISFPSVSSTSNVAVNDYLAEQLEELGFAISRTEYLDRNDVQKSNLVAVRPPVSGSLAGGGLAYFCHTDVVPVNRWTGPFIEKTGTQKTGTQKTAAPDSPADPFQAILSDDRLYGRGACDMKGSAACMLSAIKQIDPAQQTAPLWFVATADEEVGFVGAKHMVGHCAGYAQLAAADPVAIIGEPTSLNIVYAHKGIAGFRVVSQGRAGHSATNIGINANEAMVPMLETLLQLSQQSRGEGALQDSRFDPSHLSWNFGVSDHCNTLNITPGRSTAWVSLRAMPEISGQGLIDVARTKAAELGLELEMIDGCAPLWNDPDCEHLQELQSLTGTQLQTACYATDGGVLEQLSRRVVIGPGSIEQAHTVDEWISLEQLQQGTKVFHDAIFKWCT